MLEDPPKETSESAETSLQSILFSETACWWFYYDCNGSALALKTHFNAFSC